MANTEFSVDKQELEGRSRQDLKDLQWNGRIFRGTSSDDGNTFSGGWRPEPGEEGPGSVAYDVVGTRVKYVA